MHTELFILQIIDSAEELDLVHRKRRGLLTRLVFEIENQEKHNESPAGTHPVFQIQAMSSYELKSTELRALSLILRSTDLQQVAADMKKTWGHDLALFNHESVVIDFLSLPQSASSQTLDLKGLSQLLRSYRLCPVALRTQSEDLKIQALQLGLAPLTGSKPTALQTQVTAVPMQIGAAPVQKANGQKVFTAAARAQREREQVHQIQAVQPHAAAENPQARDSATSSKGHDAGTTQQTMVIDKPVRSGQQIYARGDLLVLAAVNPGAEIMADGHIHVYAPLRGKAIAGAAGNRQARIFTQYLEAELVGIAGVYRTSDQAFPKEVWQQASQISLKKSEQGENLLFTPLETG